MPATPTYTTLTGGLPANFFNFNFRSSATIGTLAAGPSLSMPALNAMNLSYNAAGGVGTLDQVASVSGSLINTTPGTTDTYLLDLTNLTDPVGNNFTDCIKVCAICFLNFSTTAATPITVGAAASNAWTGWLGASTHTITVPNGYTDPSSSNAIPGVVIVATGSAAALTVGGSSKVVKLYASYASSVTYGVVILGRNA